MHQLAPRDWLSSLQLQQLQCTVPQSCMILIEASSCDAHKHTDREHCLPYLGYAVIHPLALFITAFCASLFHPTGGPHLCLSMAFCALIALARSKSLFLPIKPSAGNRGVGCDPCQASPQPGLRCRASYARVQMMRTVYIETRLRKKLILRHPPPLRRL